MTDRTQDDARALLAKHLRACHDIEAATEVERREWDDGADMKALAEVIADRNAMAEALREARPLVDAFGDNSEATDADVRRSDSVLRIIDEALTKHGEQ